MILAVSILRYLYLNMTSGNDPIRILLCASPQETFTSYWILPTWTLALTCIFTEKELRLRETCPRWHDYKVGSWVLTHIVRPDSRCSRFTGRAVFVTTTLHCHRPAKATLGSTQMDRHDQAPVNFVYGHGNLNFLEFSHILTYYSFDFSELFKNVNHTLSSRIGTGKVSP